MANPEWTDPGDWGDRPSDSAMFDEGMAAGVEWAACISARCLRDGTDVLEALRKGSAHLPVVSRRFRVAQQLYEELVGCVGMLREVQERHGISCDGPVLRNAEATLAKADLS